MCAPCVVLLALALQYIVVHGISYDVVNTSLMCNTDNGTVSWVLTINHFEIGRWEDIVVSQLAQCNDITEHVVNDVLHRVSEELRRLQYISEVLLHDTDINRSYYPLYDDVEVEVKAVDAVAESRYRWQMGTHTATKASTEPGIDCNTAVSKLFRGAVTNTHARLVRTASVTDTLAYTRPLCFNHLPSFRSNPLVDFNGLVAERVLTEDLGVGVGVDASSGGQELYTAVFGPELGMGVTPSASESERLRARAEEAVPWRRKTRIPELFRNNGRRRFIVLQSRGTHTGGTIALNDVHKTLVSLGYREVDTSTPDGGGGSALLCNEDNYDSAHCSGSGVGVGPSRITDRDVIITGEWCGAVMADFRLFPSEATAAGAPGDSLRHLFRGRGLQYYLGFHHSSSTCAGHVRVADCHHLSAGLGERLLGGYFLGCPMTSQIQASVRDTLQAGAAGRGTEWSPRVRKENLVLIDPDFLNEYTPRQGVHFEVPPGYKAIYLSKIPHDQIPLLLQRAKILLDLALPGPERLSSEAILAGAIPVQSDQWTGSSEIDFPLSSGGDGADSFRSNKVDNLNGSDISAKLQYIADHYEEELADARHNNQYFNYILSLQRRHHNTADILFGSANFHFVLTARGGDIVGATRVEAEVACNLQLLALLFLFPMASVDLYVQDEVWYYRHHYSFVSLLRNAGYIRYDPMDPTEFYDFSAKFGAEEAPTRNYTDQRQAFVRIRSLTTLASHLQYAAEPANDALLLRDSSLCPPWEPLLVVLAPRTVFANPFSLLDMAATMTRHSAVLRLQEESKASRLYRLSLNKQEQQEQVGREPAVELPPDLGASSGDEGIAAVSLDLAAELRSPSWALVLSPYAPLHQVARRVFARTPHLRQQPDDSTQATSNAESRSQDRRTAAHLMSLCNLVHLETQTHAQESDRDDYDMLARFATKSSPWLAYTAFLAHSSLASQVRGELAEAAYLRAVCSSRR